MKPSVPLSDAVTRQVTGWIVENRKVIQATGREHVGYWHGPVNGWGTTVGPLVWDNTPSYSVAWFPTRAAAETALRSIFGRPAEWRKRGYAPIRLTAELLTAKGWKP